MRRRSIIPVIQLLAVALNILAFQIKNAATQSPPTLISPISGIATAQATTIDCFTFAGDGGINGSPETSNYSNVRNASQGVPNYTGQAANIGQNFSGNYSVYRGYFPFDTRSIPSDAQITTAVLKIRGLFNKSDTDFDLCIVQSFQTSENSLAGSDYQSIGSSVGGYLNTNSFSTSNYNQIFLDDVGKNWIVKGGITKLAIRSRDDINSSAPVNAEWIAAYCKESSYPPILTITYEMNFPPQTLGLLSPSSNETVATNEITFRWSNVNAQRYELKVDDDNNLATPEVNKTGLNTTQYPLSGNWLTPGTHYWQVIAHFSDGSSTPSSVWSFTYSPPINAQPAWVPLYRLYKAGDKDHFYCSSDVHRQTAKNSGYVDERIEGYVSINRFNSPDLVEIFRLYSNAKKAHYYTTDAQDRDNHISTGFIYEGITGYGYRSSRQDLKPLYYLQKTFAPDNDEDNFYTISTFEKDNAQNVYNFVYRGIMAYLSPDGEYEEVPECEAHQLVLAGVNTQNGNFNHYTKSSFSLSGVGPSLEFAHVYNSRGVVVGSKLLPLGPGWTHSYHIYVDPQYLDTQTAVLWPDGAVHVYLKSGSTYMRETKCFYDQLTEPVAGRFEIKKKDQTVYVFERLAGAGSSEPAMLQKIRDRNGNEITCSYYQDGKLYRVTDAVNRYLEFRYNTAQGKTSLLSEVYDSSIGRTIRFEYDDATGYLAKFFDADNRETKYFYADPARQNHLLEKIQLPEGNEITNYYDYVSRKIRQQSWGGNLYDIDYSSTENKTTVKDNGNLVATEYHNLNNNGVMVPAQISMPNGDVDMLWQDTNNPSKPTWIRDARGNVTEIVYDAMGNATEIRMPLQVTHRFQYDAMNNVDSYTDPLNRLTDYSYDAKGNLTSITDPIGRMTNFVNDNRGLVTSMSMPLHNYTYTYDGYGNIETLQEPPFLTRYDHDNAGRLIETINPKTQRTSYTYYKSDLLQTLTRNDSKSIQYAYDRNDNLRGITDPKGQSTTWGYNPQDLLTSVQNDAGGMTRYDYRSDGRLQSRTLPGGSQATYGYDLSGRLQSINYSGNSVTFGRDANGNLTSIANRLGSMSFDYDALNRMQRHTDHRNKTINYAYYKSGTLQSITYPDGKTVSYSYYNDDRLHTVTDWDGRQTTYNYRADGSLQEVIYPNNTKCAYSYDTNGRLTGITNTKSDGTIIASYTFTLDDAGNISNEQNNIPLAVPSLAPQSNGYNYSDANRLQSAGGTSFSIDPDGNTTAKNGSSVFAFEYDEENHLTTIKLNGTVTSEYFYDGLGNLRETTRNGVTTRYVVDVNVPMSQILMETDANGNPLNYYVYGLGLLYRVKANGTAHYYHYDNRGNTIAMTDQNQTITHKYVYEPFGKVLDKVEADTNPFKFVGQYGVMDESNDFYFMRARFYDAGIGRFVSEDPKWNVNLYTYAEQNPLTKIDPNGMHWIGTAYTVTTYLIKKSKRLSDGLGGIVYQYVYSDGIYSEESDKILANLQSSFSRLEEDMATVIAIYDIVDGFKSGYKDIINLGKNAESIRIGKILWTFGEATYNKIQASYETAQLAKRLRNRRDTIKR